MVYTVFGVVYNAARNNARGGALFTHVLVIKAFPGLVKVILNMTKATFLSFFCQNEMININNILHINV